MELTKYEQETIINYNQEEKNASCYTHDRALIRRLDEQREKMANIVRERFAGGKSGTSLNTLRSGL